MDLLQEKKKQPEPAAALIKRLRVELKKALEPTALKDAEKTHAARLTDEDLKIVVDHAIDEFLEDRIEFDRLGKNEISVRFYVTPFINFDLVKTWLRQNDELIKRYGWHILYVSNQHCIILPNYTDRVSVETPKILYHATPFKHVARVLKHGILPKRGVEKHGHSARSYPDRVYLSQTYNLAYDLAYTFSESDMSEDSLWTNLSYAILEVDTNKLDRGTKFFHDTEINSSGKEGIWTYSRIPPAALTISSESIDEYNAYLKNKSTKNEHVLREYVEAILQQE